MKTQQEPVAYRLWVSDDRTILVRLYPSGELEVARRGNGYEIWGPPIAMTEEKV